MHDKLTKLMQYLNREVEVLELGRKIQGQARDQMQKAEREYLLRQQLSAIRKELGEESDDGSEIKNLREKIEEAKLPPEAEKEAKRELGRMEKLSRGISRIFGHPDLSRMDDEPPLEQDLGHGHRYRQGKGHPR